MFDENEKMDPSEIQNNWISDNDKSYQIGRRKYIFDDVLDVLDVHNKKILLYGDGKESQCVSEYKTFKYPSVNKKEPSGNYISREFDSDTDFKRKDILDSVKRSMSIIRDIVMLNDCFTHFVTFTFDKSLIDRYSVDDVRDKMKNFLSNSVSRKGLAYLLVPELHSDGAIHFHGLVNNVFSLSDSYTRYVRGFDSPVKISNFKKYKITDSQVDWDKVIYNVDDFKFGYSTCISLYGDKSGVCNYVIKYMLKYQDEIKRTLSDDKLQVSICEYEECLHKIFGKRFWSSRGLNRIPTVMYKSVPYSEYDEIDSKVYVDEIHKVKFKYKSNLDFKEVT